MELEELVESVEKWHEDRNLIDGSTDKDQVWSNGFNELSGPPYINPV